MPAINILIVDDSQTVREVIIKTLGMAGVETNEIYQAGNGAEALEILKNTWVDLVFSDVNMPVMNGLDMIQKMRADEVLKTIPVIVVTTEGSKARIDQLRAQGVNGFIRKPFSPEQIQETVAGIIGGGHA